MGLHVLLAAGTYAFSPPAALAFHSSLSLTAARAILAGGVLLLLLGRVIPAPRFTLREWCSVGGLGLLLVIGNQYPFLRGLEHTAPGHPALLYATTPLGVLLLSSAIERRLPQWRSLLGVTVALAGVLILLRPWDESAVARQLRYGDAWIALAVLGWVIYTVLARPLCRRHDPRTVTAMSLLVGAAGIVPFSLPALARTEWAALDQRAWIGLLWLALITSVAMMLLWNVLLRDLDPVGVAICANAQPPAAALLAAFLAAVGYLEGEQDLGRHFLGGMALVLAGVVLVQSRRPRMAAGVPLGGPPTPPRGRTKQEERAEP